MTPPDDFTDYLAACRADVDHALDELLPGAPGCPALIAEAMRYSVTAGGKRFRPVLALAAADTMDTTNAADAAAHTGTSRDLVLPFACAIELIHTYSLVHDDLPAMDDDTLRRGRPTAHVIFGDGLAVLSGDGLLTEAFGVMSRPSAADDPATAARRLRAIAFVAEAAGAAGMVGGQAIDLQASGMGRPDTPASPLDAEALRGMHERKTGALIRAAAVAGAMMAGGSDARVRAVDDYARHLGLAFQVVDDILDVEGAAAELGKTAGKDAAAGKPTYVSLHGLDAARQHAADAADRARDALRSAGLEGRLTQIVEWVVSRTH
ncbi:MAG: polyprenyl synthetase family protein [Vicinamibacterales bacterium]|nr:polyprenyl synthetase family protein [Vicinamibacterales bacterium]MDP6607463.1 polyprenyl synthetase family protein [Vicinamibacterales bacterium]